MIILQPLAIAQLADAGWGGNSGVANLLTPDPKEVFAAGAVGSGALDFDLGSVREIDTIFLGFTNAEAGATWVPATATGMGGAGAAAFAGSAPVRAADSLGPRHHGLLRFAPVNTRYFRLYISTVAEALQAGVLMVGKAFQAPYEFGGGRGLVDTGVKERLVGGGFGIGEGAVKATLAWTFPDLAPADRRALWALVSARGETKPVVVVEETGEGAGLGEEIHYGLFDRFQRYAREAPGASRWALSMEAWA
jgi:hypothetical protein